MSELERSYRRLLRAYPASYRRERGLEILTTLLDAAEPGQTRPSRGDAVHLLLMGLRFRLVPPTPAGGFAAALVTVWAAVVLSGAGALAVWAVADPQQPSLAAFSDDLAGRPASYRSALPGSNPLETAYAYPASSEFQNYADEGWFGRRPAPIGETRLYDQVTSASAVVAQSRHRLAAAGWQTGPLTVAGELGRDRVFWAERDGQLLRVSAFDNSTWVMIGAFPAEPRGVLAGAITGFVIGLIAVWPVMVRVARTPPPARRLIFLLGLPALAACAINTVDTVLSMLPSTETASVLLAADLMYPLASQLANPLAAGVVALTAIVTAVLLRRADRRQRVPAR